MKTALYCNIKGGFLAFIITFFQGEIFFENTRNGNQPATNVGSTCGALYFVSETFFSIKRV